MVDFLVGDLCQKIDMVIRFHELRFEILDLDFEGVYGDGPWVRVDHWLIGDVGRLGGVVEG